MLEAVFNLILLLFSINDWEPQYRRSAAMITIPIVAILFILVVWKACQVSA